MYVLPTGLGRCASQLRGRRRCTDQREHGRRLRNWNVSPFEQENEGVKSFRDSPKPYVAEAGGLSAGLPKISLKCALLAGNPRWSGICPPIPPQILP